MTCGENGVGWGGEGRLLPHGDLAKQLEPSWQRRRHLDARHAHLGFGKEREETACERRGHPSKHSSAAADPIAAAQIPLPAQPNGLINASLMRFTLDVRFSCGRRG